MPTRQKTATAKPNRNSRTLVSRRKLGETPAEGNAGLVVAGLASNGVAACEWSTYPFGAVDVTTCLNAIVDAAERVNRGDLGDLEAMLTAQAVTLNAVFTELAHRARINMGEHLDAADRYTRLALKAQGQCRATVETLAAIKNPPVVFARQANIAHGPQQVNNGLSPANPQQSSRAGNPEIEQNKLLEPANAKRMDGGTADAAGASHPALATLGTGDGPADARGEGPIGQERGPRRRVATGARAIRRAKSVAPRRT
jgi:hypothetical protein